MSGEIAVNSESGSGLGGGSDVFERKQKKVIGGGGDEDYSSLFKKIVQRRSVDNDDELGENLQDNKPKIDENKENVEKHVVKRNVEDDENDEGNDFEGLLETLGGVLLLIIPFVSDGFTVEDICYHGPYLQSLNSLAVRCAKIKMRELD